MARAAREGTHVLPQNLDRLRAYLETVARLLEDKAAEREPSWELALQSEAELETLLALEAAIARKVAEIEAVALSQVLIKLAIWEQLETDGETDDAGATMRDAIVHSARRDLTRLATSPVVAAAA